jgi:hypothetical protein
LLDADGRYGQEVRLPGQNIGGIPMPGGFVNSTIPAEAGQTIEHGGAQYRLPTRDEMVRDEMRIAAEKARQSADIQAAWRKEVAGYQHALREGDRAAEPQYTLGELQQDPGRMRVTPSTYGATASLLGTLSPRPVVGQNWETGEQSYTFVNPVDRTLETKKTGQGTIASRPRRGAATAGGANKQGNPPARQEKFDRIEKLKQAALSAAERNFKTDGDQAKLEARKGAAQTSYEQAIIRAGGSVAAPAATADTVRVKLPDGRTGNIPRANLAAAKQAGAVEVPQ